MIPMKRGDKGPEVSSLKNMLIKLGYPLSDVDDNRGVFGPKVEQAVADFQERHGLAETGVVDQPTFTLLYQEANKRRNPEPIYVPPVNPAYKEAKKYEGQGEDKPKFVAWLSGFWQKLGINYKTIIGASFAWCGLFVFAMNTQVGQKAISGAAGARNWAKYGQAIDYKKNGAPRGAVVHINHAANCNSGANNHVAFLDGDCTAEDLTKKGGIVPLFGGNQSDKVKRSIFPNAHICEIRWPSELPLPAKVTNSLDCGGKSSSESTK